ncbi:tau 95 subunit of transcription factor TFIIIC [Coniothyrium glycines]
MDNHAPSHPPRAHKQYAPWLPIPSRAISVIEHPCIIKNTDKGIASLGGPVKLSKGLRSKIETTTNADGDDELKKLISVSLRPDDPFAKRLLSTPVRTNNLLLKVTVPKRTGRKRKRGSAGPFLHQHDHTAEANGETNGQPNDGSMLDAATVYQTLQDNASRYSVAIAGVMDETHRFRSMPDLQSAGAYNHAMVGLRHHVLPARYSRLKSYHVNTAAGRDLSASVGPSAEFLQMPVAFNYRFQQNTYVKYTDQGVVNLQRSIAYNAYTIIKPTDDNVPTGPKSSLPAEETLTPYLQTMIKQIRAELAIRPIITRHILYNKLGWDKRTKLRQAAVYCGYFFESGPWREALVRWGLDPRKDPHYRKYQTVSFLSYLKSGKAKHHKTFDQHVAVLSQMSREELEHEHTFDGVTVSQTGNLFQFCDISDPLIAKILATNNIRKTCAPTFQGWYHVGTWAKATVILKDKMNTIIGKGTPDNSIYERIVKWPELWDDKELAAEYKEEVSDREIHEVKKREHEVMHNVRWAARNPRYAFEKMETPAREAPRTEIILPPEEAPRAGRSDEDVPEDMTEEPVTANTMLDEDGEQGDEEDPVDDEDEDIGSDMAGGEDDQDRDSEGVLEVDDENESATSPLALSKGPAPFGGLYRV